MMKKIKENIKVEGHRGTWYEIDSAIYFGERLYLMESEIYGEDAPSIIINEHNEVIAQDIHNGFLDLDERIEYLKEDGECEYVDKILKKLIGGQ